MQSDGKSTASAARFVTVIALRRRMRLSLIAGSGTFRKVWELTIRSRETDRSGYGSMAEETNVRRGKLSTGVRRSEE
ncbi:hypothetical protein BP00DRAFT_175282 [Aspergillus indologenus CBS 114.80]|uniref:Uncharacterized protein n=1 Tax=Aspergillus indologenus CBS 114.80 TaxID=1450541 RepID=A0A2V5IS15_9EURO|nr:hypothetical protein BP00DRAFT_175282 [Aspergillus indologenus CBS 114.80]